MELDKKRFSIRRHITLVLTLLTVLIVLLIGVCVAVVREQSRIRLTSAADSYLSLLTRTLENQLVIQESYITSQVLNSEELHRLGFGEGHTQAYLDSYKLHTGFSSAMAAGNDVTALYLYSEPNSILMSEYATAQAGRPTETQIQKTNLEETLRSMVDAKTLNDERWTPYVVSGQQYWVRAVHYYGAWLISVVNLDRQCSQATDGMLAFAQPDGVLLAAFLCYIFCCAISICAVIWVLLSEMYPIKVRGLAMSIAGFSLWIGTYLIGQLTPWMLQTITPAGTFLIFAGMCIPYILIIWKLVPETTGKSLEEIEKNWIK